MCSELDNHISKYPDCTVVFEEAAEILESHIVAALTRSNQHLILIGKEIELDLLIFQVRCFFFELFFCFFFMKNRLDTPCHNVESFCILSVLNRTPNKSFFGNPLNGCRMQQFLSGDKIHISSLWSTVTCKISFVSLFVLFFYVQDIQIITLPFIIFYIIWKSEFYL